MSTPVDMPLCIEKCPGVPLLDKVTANLRLLREEELVFPRDEPPKWLSNTILKHACLQATIYTYKQHLKGSARHINTYK